MNRKTSLHALHNSLCQHFINSGILPALFLILALMLPTVSIAQDSDSDGVDDSQDNCTEIANSNQRDSNDDGFGNVCDADLDNNGSVSFADLNLFKSFFGTNNADADLDGNGSVSFADLGAFKVLFGKPPGPSGNGGKITSSESARFLTQATFGPIIEDIQHLTGQADFESWIENQFSLPPSYHLSVVKARAPDGWDTQRDRYPVFWKLALHADDQLRQRIAFALSEIMVVSDRPDPLINHGNMLAFYYDILIEHAFGNYRDLLEAVTLSPAMGIYLSMLGNETIRDRADENYAREIMQLFSIGLVKLNQDGTQILDGDGKSVPTYRQTDVANLAKVFTGWSWNRPEFDISPVAGWWPDLNRMEIPMKAFSDHHDTTAKTFLGVTLPAGQTPQQDLDDALSAISNHPNVGPFIGKQLIQRLVTSNPSTAYIARVASVFNDNGEGQRGDLKAVIKAILLDQEARSESAAQHPNFGKLREPILRFSHLWRAFNVQDPIEMDHFEGLMSQHAPLTAKSVFNFFNPAYSQPGIIKDAGLVAPEFQIDSEAWVNAINNSFLVIVQTDEFYSFFTTRLNLDTELALLDMPDQLLDHLDLLLMSGNMSSGFRQILLNYIAQNQASLDSERMLRDVLSLIITSTEYSIQR